MIGSLILIGSFIEPIKSAPPPESRRVQSLLYIRLHSDQPAWGPPRVKVRGGGGNKGSWTERQIGMLLSYLLCINKVNCHKMRHIITTMQLLSYIHLNHSKKF